MKNAAKNPTTNQLGFFAAYFCLLTSCGPNGLRSQISIQVASKAPPVASSADGTMGQETEFSLFENMSHFNLEISGCASGYTALFDKSTMNQIKLFKNDQNCLAKLLGFTSADGTIYTPKSGFGFTTYLQGDSATFINSSLTKSVRVTVSAQLSTPIASGDTIDYRFSSLNQNLDSKTILKPTWDAAAIIIKQPAFAPQVQIRHVRLTGLNTTAKKGLFDVYIECNIKMVSGRCNGVDNDDLKFDLNLDASNNCSAQTPSNCEAKVTRERGATVVNPGDPILPNGGFILTEIDTPVALVDSKNMIFSVKRLANRSANPPTKESILAWNFDLELQATFSLSKGADQGSSRLQEP